MQCIRMQCALCGLTIENGVFCSEWCETLDKNRVYYPISTVLIVDPIIEAYGIIQKVKRFCSVCMYKTLVYPPDKTKCSGCTGMYS